MDYKVEIKKVLSGEKSTKAYADVVIDGAIVIHDIGVIETEKGRFAAMPRKKWTNRDGEERQQDICHPITSAAREQIQTAVLAAYDEAVKA